MNTSRRRARLAALVVAAMAGLGLSNVGPVTADTAPAAGVPATVSADPLPTWQITGVVWSQVTVGNTVYATGNFTKARPPGMWQGGPTEITVGHLIAYDITTGQRVASFNHILNAQGMAITASPDGSRIYVGGDFTTVDGIARSHIAAFDTATGNLSTSFAPAINGQVRAITANNSTVYAGGAFESAAGVARTRLASFSAANGAMSPTWAPTAPDGYVYSLVLTPDQSKVVVGGQFDTLNGAPAHGMGAVDPVTGLSVPWVANTVIKDALNGAITSLRTDGTSILGSGFAFGSGAYFEGSFSLNPANGAINWLNDCQGDTYDVLPVGQVVYSVSHAHNCTMVGSFPDTNPRVRWQHALATTNYATGVNNGPDIYGWNYKGQPDATVLHWYPDLGIGTFTGQYQAAWSLTGNGTYVALGGEFPTVNGGDQQGLTRFAVATAAPNKVGPQYTTNPSRPTPATNASSTLPGTVQVSFGTAWDMDNQKLTYEVIRDGQTVVYTTQASTNFWTLPTLSFTDSGVPGGTHSYQVRIKDPFNNSLMSPVSNTVTVIGGANQPPVASFTSSTANLVASFNGSGSSDPDGTISSYAWNFGDNTTGTGATQQHTYAAAGTYSVTLTVTDNAGATNAVTKPVTVTAANQPPVASFTSSTANLVASFNGSGSSDPDGTISAYAWNFGDNTTGTGATPQHTYAAAGTYSVTLTVTDNAGATNAVTKPVTVSAPANQPPVASFTSSTANLVASFNGSGSSDPDGTISSYAWNFGDNTTGTGATQQHTYAAAGTYSVTLTVTDNAGATNAVTKPVTVTAANQPPVASFTSSTANLVASFNGSGSSDPDGTISAYAWNFGDNTTGTGATPQHTYAAAGTYSVTLTVTDNAGATNAVTKPVTVTAAAGNQPPVAAFTSSSLDLTVSVDGSGSSDPDGTIASYTWAFGDGSSGTGVTSSHTYAAAGSYQVTLTVKDDKGATTALTKPVSVAAPFAKDLFARTAANGWGSADIGGAWSTYGGSTNFSVGGGVGRLVTPAPAGGVTALLNGVSSTNTDLQLQMALDKMPTGGGQFFWAIGRGNSSDGYRAKVWVSSTGTLVLYLSKFVAGAETELTNKVITGSYVPGDTYQVRLQVFGTGTTSLQAKTWKVGTTEPTTWAVTATDTTASLQQAGAIGLVTYLSKTATNAPITISVGQLYGRLK